MGETASRSVVARRALTVSASAGERARRCMEKVDVIKSGEVLEDGRSGGGDSSRRRWRIAVTQARGYFRIEVTSDDASTGHTVSYAWSNPVFFEAS